MELTPEEIEFEAHKVISGFPENAEFLLMGMPVGSPRLREMKLPTPGICMTCGKSVQSTVVKDRILKLRPSAKLLCANCYKEYLQQKENYQLGYYSL